MDMDFLVQIGLHTRIRLTVWLRGVELEVRGYVEKADRRVGIMTDTLVIEELRPITPNSRWREPDIDDLLATGEYAGIESAFFETYDRLHESDWMVYSNWYWYDDAKEALAHEEWLVYWMPQKAPGAGDQS